MLDLSVDNKIILSDSNFNQNIEELYKIFLSIYGNVGREPILLDGKRIFVDLRLHIEFKKETFWHMCSLGPNENFNVLPCKNDISRSYCCRNCTERKRVIMLPKQRESRFCMYRAIRLHWFKEIIDMANEGSEYITTWEKEGNKYIRYRKATNDTDEEFIVVLKIMKGSYRYVSSYPIFYINASDNFEQDYQNYSKNK